MKSEDVIYAAILILTICFGPIYRKIPDVNTKKWISTVIGFSIVSSVSGIHVLHFIIVTAVNSYLIINTSKKSCHKISFAFTFLYLLFFRTTEYFGIPYAPAHANLIQMLLTLKIVGLAFEVHDKYEIQQRASNNDLPSSGLDVYPTLMDIFHYAFCYVGVLTGPYYSYKTFHDHLYTDFGDYAPRYSTLWKKVTPLPSCAAAFLLMSHYFTVDTMTTDAFYENSSFLYRFFYMFPVYGIFRTRLHIAFILSECVCIMAGLGAYPVATKPRSGMGPSTEQGLVEKLATNKELAKTHEYNFATVNNLNLWDVEIEDFRNSIKDWNMCVQFWMAHIVYRRFPYKSIRLVVVFLVSAYWHGIYLGHYFTLVPPFFVIFVQDLYEKILKINEATGKKKYALRIVRYTFTCHMFAYLGISFCLLTMQRCIRYYASIYWIHHVFLVVLAIIGTIIKGVSSTSNTKEKIK